MSHMKISYYLPSLLIAAISGSAMGQTAATDTVGTQLKEIVVEAELQNRSTEKTTYIPDKHAKSVSHNAIDLLSHMAIPQISVNPVDNTVQTIKGDDIAIYIDMSRASKGEKEALRAEDVRRVEYYVTPTDPRFNHEKYVVNIVLRHYEYGGYAKFNAYENFMAGSGGGSAYSKVAYKRMTYDIYAADKYTDRHHTGTEERSIYRLPKADGTLNEIVRDNTLSYSRYQENAFSSSIRAKYQSDKISATNEISLTTTNTPRNNQQGEVSFSNADYETSSYLDKNGSKVIAPTWEGNYYFDMGKGYTMLLMPSFQYQYTRMNRLYTSSNTDIVTNASDKAAMLWTQVQINKTINEHNTIDVNGYYIYNYDDVNYEGSTDSGSKFYQTAYAIMPAYTAQYGNVYSRLMTGIIGERNKVGGTKNSRLSPFLDLSVQYTPTRKSSFEFEFSYNVNGVEPSDKTPDVIQQNEFMYKTGNANLKNSNFYLADISYTWLANNRYSLSGYARYNHKTKYWVAEYTPNGPNGTILRSMTNDGSAESLQIGLSGTAKLFNRSLVLKANPKMYADKREGIYAKRSTNFTVELQATYYFGKFYVSAYYNSRVKRLTQYIVSEDEYDKRSSYQIKGGWKNGNWNITLSATNIFRRDWRSGTSRLVSPYYENYTRDYGASRHQFVQLGVSYTFGFGKKMRRGDEVGSKESKSSAIIK